MHRQKPVSDTQEMYLKTLYRLRGERKVARVRDVATGLGVSPATVSSVLKTLERLHLIDHERYGLIALTPAGNRLAESVIERFETLRAILVEVFGVDPDVASVDACMMEHAVSPATIRQMRSVLESVRRGKGRPRRRRAKGRAAASGKPAAPARPVRFGAGAGTMRVRKPESAGGDRQDG